MELPRARRQAQPLLLETNDFLDGLFSEGATDGTTTTETTSLQPLDINSGRSSAHVQPIDLKNLAKPSISARFPNPAQHALNALSRSSPPRRGELDTNTSTEHPGDEFEMEIDIERELELEEELRAEDRMQAEIQRALEEEEEMAMLEMEQEEDRLKRASLDNDMVAGVPKPLGLELESNGLLDCHLPSTTEIRTQPFLSPFSDSMKRGEVNRVADPVGGASRHLPDRETMIQALDEDEIVMEAGPSSRGIGGSSRTRRVEESIPRYIPAGTVTATCLDGKEVRFEKRKKMKGWKPPLLNFKEERGSGLLSRPIHRLLEDVEALKALEVVEMEEMEERRASTAKIARRNASSNAGKMWVDRYRPRKFTELLGDERIHRDVMSWLKEWDECVFKRKNPRRSRHQQYRKDAATAAMVPGSSAFGQDQSNQWRDPYGRPQERVLLISGPPGLGKTTLAHVIASQAGYNVFELNASDSRTASAVEDQIRMALESASMKDPRPTLVVIDEIDGATGGGAGEGAGAGFVKALIRLIEGGKGWAKAKKSFASSKAKPKKGVKPLLRPIICICNDLYAPSLRPLRPLARLIRFSKAPTNILVRRLREICEIEAVKADTRGLSLLSELTGGDIRSCLNALEFAKAKDIRLTEGEIRNASIGIKDTGTSVHKVWELLFRTQNRKAKDKATFKGLQTRQTEASTPWNSGNAGETKKASEVMIDSPNENLYRLVHEIQSCNEYEKLAQGCFEHYPSLRTSDDGWKRFERVHDWLDFGQNLHQKIWSGGHYELMGFLPWTFVPWHLLFANSGNALPEYPRVDYENYLKVTAFDEVATSLHLSLPPNLRSQFNKNSVVTELGPSLMRMLNPDLKLVNSQVVRPEQRATLDSLVKIMLSLNLSFVQDRNEDGQLVYKLEPPLDLFVQYDGKRSKEVGPGRFSVRQTIAKELETAALRIKNGMLGDKDDGNGKSTSGSRAIAVYKKGGEQGSNPLEEKKEKIAVDFFGRPIVKKERSKGEKTLQPVPIPVGMGNKKRKSPGDGKVGPAPPPEDEERSGPELAEMEAPTSSPPAKEEGVKVFYRYHEGYSNAVRKPLKLSSLL